MADKYVGKVTKVKKESGKIIVHGTLMKGNLHGHSAMLVFEDNPEVKKIIGNNYSYLVTFGRRSFWGNRFNGRIAKDIELPEKKNDQVVIPIIKSPLLEIMFLDNVMADDNFLTKYLKRNKKVSVQFFDDKKSETTLNDNYENIYKVRDIGPWTSEEPPKQLVDLIEKGIIKPCRALDVGCGEGFYSKFLAEKGFEVTGIDFSKLAIAKAKLNAPEVDFKVIDAVKDNLTRLGKYDFCLEWSIMHCIPPEQRKQYVAKIADRMNPKGLLLSTSFNYMAEKHGKPKQRKRNTSGSTTLWFSSLNEMKKLFKSHYNIIEANTQKILGNHLTNYLLLKKR